MITDILLFVTENEKKRSIISRFFIFVYTKRKVSLKEEDMFYKGCFKFFFIKRVFESNEDNFFERLKGEYKAELQTGCVVTTK